MQTRLLLIRHATTDYVGRALAGRLPGIPLNEQGRREATQLAEQCEQAELAAIYASPLERAQETAAALASSRQMEVQTEPGLLELDYGEWTGRRFDELEPDPAWKQFNAFRSTLGIPGGETLLAVQLRAVAALERIRQRHIGQTVAVVSHADTLRAALTHYLGMPLDLGLRIEILPARVSAIELASWGPRLLCLNAAGWKD